MFLPLFLTTEFFIEKVADLQDKEKNLEEILHHVDNVIGKQE